MESKGESEKAKGRENGSATSRASRPGRPHVGKSWRAGEKVRSAGKRKRTSSKEGRWYEHREEV
eukprot:4575812-Pleurochrysis_carterae.AAC.3